MSFVTYVELRAGLEMKHTNRAHDDQVSRLLTTRIPVLPLDDEAANACGVLQAAVLEPRRDALDRLIAAHAVSLNLVLVTNYEAEFVGYPGLQVENWGAGE